MVVGILSVSLWSSMGTVPGTAQAQRAEVSLITLGRDGSPANGRSELPTANGDASVIGFKSAASNLIASDVNSSIDVFVYSRNGGSIERIPATTSFPPSNPDGESFPPGLDYSGNIVGFASAARNLVRNDLNQQVDAFAYDRGADNTEILTLVLDEVEEGSLGGRVPDLPISVNADGNLMVFTSGSDFLVDNDRNEVFDVFLYNRISDETELVSVATLGGGGPRSGNDLSANGAISGDGNFVVFCSEASNLTTGTPEDFAGIFLRNRIEGTTQQVASLAQRRCLQREASPSISENGAYIAFVSELQLDDQDTNGVSDVFVWHDGSTIRISEALGGGPANGPSSFASISANGTFVAFQSSASNLIDGDDNQNSDVFVVDVIDRRITRASETAGGEDFPAASGAPRISPDGITVVFQSDAPLAPEDLNTFTDIYSVVNVLSFTPTPTPTTPTETPTAPPPTVTQTRTPTGDGVTPTATPDGIPTTTTPSGGGTPTPTTPGGGTPTPTATNGRGGGGGGGGGGGCSCRIDPSSGRPADPAPWQALLLPAALWGWRRRSGMRS
jgi:Tol biopolymer transport system component